MKKVIKWFSLFLAMVFLGAFLVFSVMVGGRALYGYACARLEQLNEDVHSYFTSERIIERVKTVELEPAYGGGLEGTIKRYANKHRVPVAIAFSVAVQEGGLRENNLQINCPAKFAARADRHRYCAYGLFQLIPAFNEIQDPRSIWGPENLEANIDEGCKRLRKDYDLSKGKSERDRWYGALVRYYGAEQDNYQRDVLARAVEMALRYG